MTEGLGDVGRHLSCNALQLPLFYFWNVIDKIVASLTEIYDNFKLEKSLINIDNLKVKKLEGAI